MSRRSPARFLAPIFLVAVVVATFIIVQQYRDGSAEGTSTSTTTTSTTSAGGKGKSGKSGKKKKARRVYVVKQGDILTTVSEKTGVSVEELQELNPDLDPQSLQVGQRLKLGPRSDTDDDDSNP